MNDRPVGQPQGPAAAQVVWRVLLRRGIPVENETAQAVAGALQEWFQAARASRPSFRPGRRAAPGGACDPLFPAEDVPPMTPGPREGR